jgi:GTP-binding protein HflX
MSTRLIRGWTHLERQKGGIGLRGPGETQLETDRRLLRARIKSIKKRLGKVKSQRHQSRRSRRRADLPTISLVGYTNAGKSTLFNRLTGAEVYVADQLFATLDPTMRAIKLPSQGTVIFADTVGFISHLPHKLIEAFRATLEEAANATLLLEVVDANSSELADNIQRVEEVLGDIEADEIPTLRVYNKIDSLDGIEPHIERDVNGVAVAVWLSAATGAGLDLLCEALKERLAKDSVEVSCYLAPQSGRLRALFYEADSVLAEHIQNDGATIVDIRMPKEKWHRLLKSEGIEAADLIVEKTHSEGQCSELPRDRLVLAG